MADGIFSTPDYSAYTGTSAVFNDAVDNIDVGGGWNPAAGFTDTTPNDYSNEGRAYTNPGSTAGSGGSPANASVTSDLPGINVSGGVGDLFKKLISNPDGTLNTKVVGALGGAGISALASMFGLDKTNKTPTGYQGKVPQLTAQRTMLTAPPPGRRPGSGGINYGGNVTYMDKTGAPVGAPRALSAADLAAAAQGNPYNSPAAPAAPVGLLGGLLGGTGGGNTMDMINRARAIRAMQPNQPTADAWMTSPYGNIDLRQMQRAVQTPQALREVDAPEANMRPVTGTAPNYAHGGLTSNGFVIPADVVSHFGNGSTNAGLRLLAEKFGAEPIHGKGDGMSDSIKTHIDGKQEARVADGEAFISPETVAKLGNGSPERGAKKLYAMLDKVRKARTGNPKQGKEINPEKFMPGGAVGYAAGGVPSFAGETGSVPSAAAISGGLTGTESSLSNWAGDYVTNMLGKGQALSEEPYQAYTGQLTAGPSDLQNKVFTGLQNTNFPGNLGQSFTNTTAPTVGAGGQPSGGGGIASTYMNPYLQNVLQPQLAELNRQAQINNLSGVGALTKSGAFGGGRQAIMESEANRNLLTAQNNAIGQGYANAYDKAMQQFNTEQNQGETLANLMASQGNIQRGIESEGVAADKAQFEEARLNPYKMVQFQQSLLSGLPLTAQSYNVAEPSTLQKILSGAGGGANLLGGSNTNITLDDVSSALGKLGITIP